LSNFNDEKTIFKNSAIIIVYLGDIIPQRIF